MESMFIEIVQWRAIERIFSILVGGFSIAFGWHLFLKGVVQEQTAEIEGHSVKVRLQKVGPGVFFGIFGAAMITYVATTKAEFSAESTQSIVETLKPLLDGENKLNHTSTNSVNAQLGYAVNQPSDETLIRSISINTLAKNRDHVLEVLAENNLNDKSLQLIKEAIINLEILNKKELLTLFPVELRKACITHSDFPINYSEDSCVSFTEHKSTLDN